MSNSHQDNIVDLKKFREKKSLQDKVAPGRTPLYVSHLDGKVKGNPNRRPSSEDFGDRLQRIRTSLEKINSLMAELKKQSNQNKGEAKK